jgi:hypothetical protein
MEPIAATVAGRPTALVTTRPVSHPQHTISDVGLVGRGQGPLPGDVSRAQYGMLFWDERRAWRRHCLEVLRQPLEERCYVQTISRTSSTSPRSPSRPNSWHVCRPLPAHQSPPETTGNFRLTGDAL